jgi:predicted glycosyltransferase
MSRYLFSSHDGYGLGHVRRNSLIAAAIVARDPEAEIVLVTGLAVRPRWLGGTGISIVNVRPLLKASDGSYRSDEVSFEEAIAGRSATFRHTIETFRPDVVVVDRHPYGTAGELIPGLEIARTSGAATVLGLRDVLDEPSQIRAEMRGQGWSGVGEMFDDVLVYGSQNLCDHQVEYGLAIAPQYCGWVVQQPPAAVREAGLIVVTAGGGGDGDSVFRLGIDLASMLPQQRAVVVAGPYAAAYPGTATLPPNVSLVRDAPGCAELFARAESVVQMAGYNSTFESLAAGVRPVLVPRRSPRREQAIRASRLTALGLADVADEDVKADEVAWLLRRDRLLAPSQLADCGVRLDGAQNAAAIVGELARRAVSRGGRR